MKVKFLVINAMLTAMCTVLGMVAVDLGFMKITFESFPVFLAALLLGPVCGLVTGTAGTFIYQLIRYGVTATTPLWILPYAAAGFLLGLFAKKKSFTLSRKETAAGIITAELIITGLNTLAIYADAVIYGYYFKGYITASLLLRVAVCIAKAAAFGIVMPKLINVAKKVGKC